MMKLEGRTALIARRVLRLGPGPMLALLAALPACEPAFAQLTISTEADVQHQESSNVFDLPPGQSPTGYGSTSRSDSFNAYGGSINASYDWSRQNLDVNLDAHEFRYDRFTDLDHDEYKLNGTWNWKAGDIFEGSVGIYRTRSMVAFYDLVGPGLPAQTAGTELSVQTTQSENASLAIKVTPDWRIEAGASNSDSDSPRTGEPNLSLRETGTTGALKYTGEAGLAAGVSASYSDGQYKGTDGSLEPSYHQSSAQFVATYSLTQSEIVNFAAGYTSRNSADGLDDTSGATGSLSYQRDLTGKTSFKLSVSRGINSYITTTGSEIDSSAGLSLNWQATYKIAVSPSYTYTYSDLPRQGLNGADRLDHFRTFQINIDYKMRDWLEFRPFARWETRTSDLVGAPYSADIFGINAYIRWQTH
jgi:hypothetical protein